MPAIIESGQIKAGGKLILTIVVDTAANLSLIRVFYSPSTVLSIATTESSHTKVADW